MAGAVVLEFSSVAEAVVVAAVVALVVVSAAGELPEVSPLGASTPIFPTG